MTSAFSCCRPSLWPRCLPSEGSVATDSIRSMLYLAAFTASSFCGVKVCKVDCVRQDGQLLEVLTVNETFVGGRLCQTLRSSVTWQKQALYGEVSKPIRIGHSIRHQVQKLSPDGDSQLTILGIIAKGVIRL